jgi:hypothetical protein
VTFVALPLESGAMTSIVCPGLYPGGTVTFTSKKSDAVSGRYELPPQQQAIVQMNSVLK